MRKEKAVWFSRHVPTPEQEVEFDLVAVEEGRELGARSITSPAEAEDVAYALRALANASGARTVVGVFSTLMLAEAWKNALFAVTRGDFVGGTISLRASVNEARSPEGGRPTFSHLRWEEIGVI